MDLATHKRFTRLLTLWRNGSTHNAAALLNRSSKQQLASLLVNAHELEPYLNMTNRERDRFRQWVLDALEATP